MIISHSLRYVYIGIPRTGSKSMCRWLMDHYQGKWVGGHHDWKVPAECEGYRVFTVVRNPYEIQASGWFFEPVIKDPNAPPKAKTYAEAGRNWIRPTDQPVSQKEFIEWAGVQQILFFEHLPNCLNELPFVNSAHVPPFPHLNAGGYRPPGTFFDLMSPGDEQLVWDGCREDFEFLGYARHNCGGPANQQHPLRQRVKSF
jgi:hypothetical protein